MHRRTPPASEPGRGQEPAAPPRRSRATRAAPQSARTRAAGRVCATHVGMPAPMMRAVSRSVGPARHRHVRASRPEWTRRTASRRWPPLAASVGPSGRNQRSGRERRAALPSRAAIAAPRKPTHSTRCWTMGPAPGIPMPEGAAQDDFEDRDDRHRGQRDRGDCVLDARGEIGSLRRCWMPGWRAAAAAGPGVGRLALAERVALLHGEVEDVRRHHLAAHRLRERVGQLLPFGPQCPW